MSDATFLSSSAFYCTGNLPALKIEGQINRRVRRDRRAFFFVKTKNTNPFMEMGLLFAFPSSGDKKMVNGEEAESAKIIF